MDYIGGSSKAAHLCVLVHGLWGNPDHMRNIAKSLRAQYPPDDLYLLLAKSNSGSFTYDGIERGGERICAEIEKEIKSIESQGGKIEKLSIIGYSLGGLVSRYAVGLLYAKGILDRVECMNFTTFVSPHLGARSPLKGWHNHIWNVLGARSLSTSGRQLFIIDDFRGTGRPLLSVLADPASIFIRGLRKFKRHTLYMNITNDRSAVYYTTAIEKTDPYRDLKKVQVKFLKGCEGVILDPDDAFASQPKLRQSELALSTATSAGLRWIKSMPMILVLLVLVPLSTIVFLCNSVLQNMRSRSRIRLHDNGQGGLDIQEYRMPFLMNELQGGVENAYGAMNSFQSQDFLAAKDDAGDEALGPEERRLLGQERRLSVPTRPTLALTVDQFEMIRSLDTLKWRKYPVWIHQDRHSHAAIIVRKDKSSFSEGYVVLKHYAETEFLS